jgi:protocatechuate 3,4-dioxygenase beta subunit
MHSDGTHEIEDHDRGLVFDLGTLSRRGALGLFGGAGLWALVGCSTDGSGPASSASSTASASSAASAGSSAATSTSAAAPTTAATASTSASADVAVVTDFTEIPEETAGPYPGDGSNGPNVLTESGIVRSDLRASFDSSTTVAKGVPLTTTLSIFDSANNWAPIVGAAVYLWHCNIDGEYSLYGKGVTNENYLRGVQATDSAGKVTFTSIFPAAYSGRWPHIHFEVYSSLSEATAAGKITATSQIAMPSALCDAVYATDGYSASVRNMSQISLSSDNVFGNDSGIHQIPTYTGDVANGYSIALNVGV